MVLTAHPAERFNLTAHVLRKAEVLARKPALQILHPTHREDWSYADLQAAILGAGTGLRDMGLGPGDRIVLHLGATPAFPIAFLGAIAAGLVAVPVSPALTPAEMGAIVQVLRPAALVSDTATELGVGVALRAAQILAMKVLPPCPYDLGDPNRLAYVIFTSGTTSGRPLPVAHAHRAILARAMMQHDWEGLRQDDRLLHAGALNWTFTLGTGLMDPWCCGATALIPAPGTEAAALPQLMSRSRATILAAAPGIFRRVLRAGLPPLPDLRHGLCAGEALDPQLRAQWQAHSGTDLHEAMGMTEISTYISGAPGRPAPAGSMGFAQTGRRIALISPQGAIVAPGQAGQIGVHRGDPGLMLGYLDRPDETAARFCGDWFLTGDWAVQRPDQSFVGMGRHDDLINAGGIRVSPLEIEAALQLFPGLSDAAVTEIEVRRGVRVIAAFYTAGQPLDEAALSAHCAAHLAAFKCPRLFVRLDHLPRNANSKLDRRALRRLDPPRPQNDPS